MNYTGHLEDYGFQMQKVMKNDEDVALELDSESWEGIMNPDFGSGNICLLISQLNLLSILPVLCSVEVCCIILAILQIFSKWMRIIFRQLRNFCF